LNFNDKGKMAGKIMTEPRFVLAETKVGMSYVRDTKDNSAVCLICTANRPPRNTEAMAAIIVDALNTAVRGAEKGHDER
jgi:hypothetical protein